MKLVPAEGEKEILSLGPPSLRASGTLSTVYVEDRRMGLEVDGSSPTHADLADNTKSHL